MTENESHEENESHKENDSQKETDESIESEPLEEVAPLSFNEWFEQSKFINQPEVLEDVNEWTVEEIVQYYAETMSIPDDWYALAYTDLINNTTYSHREDQVYIAASTTKVLYAMLYYDLIESGEITADSLIPYAPSHYQGGGGEITAEVEAGLVQEGYALDYVIQELISHSDNSAWLMLIDYYNLNHGNIYEALSEMLTETDDVLELFYENKSTTSYLEEMMFILLEKDRYQPILEYMRQADEDMFLLYHIDNHHPVKYGLLYDLKHHIGILEVEQQPVSTLAIFTDHLSYQQANEFMGGIGLQLLVKSEYDYYLNSFEG